MQHVPATEGFLPFHGYRTWYHIVGEREEPGKLPLLVLHGGPGASHDYLEPLAVMAQAGRRVIFYDQLGGGNSIILMIPRCGPSISLLKSLVW